jgi:hypothetical protein
MPQYVLPPQLITAHLGVPETGAARWECDKRYDYTKKSINIISDMIIC